MMPEYTDGVLDLYQIEEDSDADYPLERLRNMNMRIWYRELSVFDTTKAKLSTDGVEVTMKICIPRYKKINSKSVCMIDGVQYEVYNAAHVTSKEGFQETELTLKTPVQDREIIDE